jgi:Fe-S-cluster-containing hydrogenase component 2
MLTFDPDGLTGAQRDGEACVVCHKRWPRPRVRVGKLPDNSSVLACTECAEALLPAPMATVVAFPSR